MKVVILSRVNTQNQDNQRQINELTDFSKNRNWDVVKVYEEKISGITKNEERPILIEMITFIQKNNIDKVLCWKLSRLGRNTVEVLQTIELLNEKKISLFIKNYNLETFDDNQEVLPLSQFLIQILSSAIKWKGFKSDKESSLAMTTIEKMEELWVERKDTKNLRRIL